VRKMAKKKEPIMVETRQGPVALDTIMEIVRNRLMRAIREKHFVTLSQWYCAECEAKMAGQPFRTLLAISDSEKPLAVGTATHCPTCGTAYPLGAGA